MILVKNKLRKKKNTIEDEEYLNYLKYSHLPTIREYDDLPIETENKSTQYPDIQNKFTQQIKKTWWIKKLTQAMTFTRLTTHID